MPSLSSPLFRGLVWGVCTSFGDTPIYDQLRLTRCFAEQSVLHSLVLVFHLRVRPSVPFLTAPPRHLGISGGLVVFRQKVQIN